MSVGASCGRTVDELSTCLSEWRSRGFDVHTCVADVSTEEGRGVLVHEAETLFGDHLHCLVNNVGFNIRKKVLDYTDDDYSRIMSTNLDSAFALCKALHGMLKQSLSSLSSMQEGPASVVNVGSVAGKYLRTSCTYIAALNLDKTSLPAQRLKNWKDPTKIDRGARDRASTLQTSGDFSDVLEAILKVRVQSKSSTATLGEVNLLLDALVVSWSVSTKIRLERNGWTA